MITPVKENFAISPVDFYGNGLPRPRFYYDPQFNAIRVDPPISVLDPRLSGEMDAHSSMGGLKFTCLRLQGQIEGIVNQLRAQLEKSTPVKLESGNFEKKKKRSSSESLPPTPIAVKRRRFLDLNDEIGSEDEGLTRIRRKLSDDFDRVAGENKANVVKANKKTIESESVEKKLNEKNAVEVNQTS